MIAAAIALPLPGLSSDETADVVGTAVSNTEDNPLTDGIRKLLSSIGVAAENLSTHTPGVSVHT